MRNGFYTRRNFLVRPGCSGFALGENPKFVAPYSALYRSKAKDHAFNGRFQAFDIGVLAYEKINRSTGPRPRRLVTCHDVYLSYDAVVIRV